MSEPRPPSDYHPDEHHVAVTYTNRDDGIHVECSCGFDQSADFWPTPLQLLYVDHAHRLSVSKEVTA